ncbi:MULTISPECIES: peptidoglycan-binding protein [unclassified Leptolyngbya]|uniref:peptidoglycan-binding protein n=1 Tax=unclassified Leptolyngbya TaxID=2650499 RepID=UPI0016853796|nr:MULTISPECIES: peptidoglycan-binding protein [unclassified Leptolyngbya]MBD1913566.1 peptidoglycan-binding protein [Leptolyngbya sp. FACHB-8]MBD2155863.1 peptidoglycan-binding protein [Leptolyngbya sp. FACHB-16]
MENFAFLHAFAAYEDPSEAPKVRSLEDMGLVNPAMLGIAAGAIAGFMVLTTPSDAQAYTEYGDRGAAVYEIQSVLNGLGYSVGPLDGVFGSATRQAVINFQRNNGLSVDGVVGPATASALGGVSYDPDPGQGGSGGGPNTVTISTNGSPLTVRSGPGTGYAAIDYISNGSSVTVVDYSGGWYELAGGGWISSTWTVGGGGGGGGGGNPGGDGGSGSIRISTNGSELVARSGPGSGYAVTGGYGNGAVVRFYDYYGGWYETDQGWVSASWVYEL